MALHKGFIQDIQAHPADDDPRLIYADWLEERDDPLGTFIRAQCELAALDPIRDRSRHDQLHAITTSLEQAHRSEWLGPLASLPSYRFFPTFRRGFVERAEMSAEAIRAHGDDLAGYCPLLQDVTLYTARGKVEFLLRAIPSNQWRRIVFADLLTPEDCQALSRLAPPAWQSLTLWGRDRVSNEQQLQSLFSHSKWEHLHELVLQQMYGGLDTQGITAGWAEQDLGGDHWIRSFNAQVQQQSGRDLLTVFRPYAHPFPLRSSRHYGFWTGSLQNGRQAIAMWVDDSIVMNVLSSYGILMTVEVVQSPEIQGKPLHDHDWSTEKGELKLLDYLQKAHGFEEGLIYATEHANGYGFQLHLHPSHHLNLLREDPDEWQNEWNELFPPEIQRWIESGCCIVTWQGDHTVIDGNGHALF